MNDLEIIVKLCGICGEDAERGDVDRRPVGYMYQFKVYQMYHLSCIGDLTYNACLKPSKGK